MHVPQSLEEEPMPRFTLFSCLLLSLFVSATAQAQTSARAPMMPSVDPAFFNGLHYRLVGPSRGGRVNTVTGVPSQPKTFYMGVADGGLFRTTDAGATWLAITDGKVPVGSTGAVGVPGYEPRGRYHGTGSGSGCSN